MPKYEVLRSWVFSCLHEVEAVSKEEAISLTDSILHTDEEWLELAQSAEMDYNGAEANLVTPVG